ncbi:methylated-DNA--[protein]-cysteine S-methyltransferase [Streptomyces durbertensis]|uniref:Methylated-DNA--[protein]-cysteine S-methyltransferase n=1 Tax=Streptomyces durbertensis TaxID=2448886 RepID=A0ABR6EC47_9ACTN|nr:methylated-DNA--[protein]-cysteine S-methyltransferase [Streptomyces durbertensis]MBB1242902.1 methylated-DNA--[protein]-cysteine S-methyltransferase [Streptomyces durbertensis]
MDTRHTVVDTDLGALTVVAGERALTGLYFAEHARRPAQEAFGPRVTPGEDGLLDDAAGQLHDYLAGRRRDFALPLAPHGDAFQLDVWELVATVTHGTTTTYGELARRLGDVRLAQRVGQAVGANPLCILIPCHRVLGAGGALTGYAGGLARKRALLDLEEPEETAASRLF